MTRRLESLRAKYVSDDTVVDEINLTIIDNDFILFIIRVPNENSINHKECLIIKISIRLFKQGGEWTRLSIGMVNMFTNSDRK
jgi:hypothetical protein